MKIEYITMDGGMGRIAKCVSAPHVNVWGTGVDDLEALTDLRMKIAGDDFETVETVNVNHRRF